MKIDLKKIASLKRKRRMFLIALTLTLLAAFYFFFFSKAKDAFSLGGLFIIANFILLVRYWLRPLLSKRWSYFNEKKSAPYIMVFLIIQVFCAIFLFFKLESAAKHFSIIGYFLLVVGVSVEFTKVIKAKGSDEVDNQQHRREKRGQSLLTYNKDSKV